MTRGLAQSSELADHNFLPQSSELSIEIKPPSTITPPYTLRERQKEAEPPISTSLQTLSLQTDPTSPTPESQSLRNFLETWSKSSPQPHIARAFEKLSQKSDDKTLVSKLTAYFNWRDGDADRENLCELPEEVRQNLYDLDADGRPRKVLRPDVELGVLVREGFVEFLMGAWVHPPVVPEFEEIQEEMEKMLNPFSKFF